MKFLLDTCVLSEMVKPKRNENVLAWLATQHAETLYVSALTLGELRKGITKLPASSRKNHLATYLQTDIMEGFKGRILDVDGDIAMAWGALSAKAELAGQRMPAVDSLIAATALFHDMTLVTRNTRDMVASGAALFDPWQP